MKKNNCLKLIAWKLLNNGEILCVLQKRDRKSTRLNSSHVEYSYAVFCLKKKLLLGMGRRLAPKEPHLCRNRGAEKPASPEGWHLHLFNTGIHQSVIIQIVWCRPDRAPIRVVVIFYKGFVPTGLPACSRLILDGKRKLSVCLF